MVGKNGATRAVPARVMRHGNQMGSILVAPSNRDGVQGAERRRQIKVAAPETAVELLAARVNAGRFFLGEIEDAAMVPARGWTRPGWHQTEERFFAGFVKPLHRAARLFLVGPPAGQVPASLLGADEVLNGWRVLRRVVRIEMFQQQIQTARIKRSEEHTSEL